MSWTFVKSESKKITTKLASEFAEMTPAPGDRILSERRLQVYEKIVRAGQWRPCSWAKVNCEETNDVYRVNGKHTSTLFSSLASEFTDLNVNVETYQCDTLEDVGRLYSTFDASINSRTTSDINRAFAQTVPELNNVSYKVIDAAASGMSQQLAGGNPSNSRNTPQERAENLLIYSDFVIWLGTLIYDTTKYAHLKRQGVVAAIFGNYQKCKSKCNEFWTLVRDETGERPDCPDRQLSRWLLTTSSRQNSERSLPGKRKADPREFYVRCLYCWNSWRRGESMRLIKYYSQAKVPSIV